MKLRTVLGVVTGLAAVAVVGSCSKSSDTAANNWWGTTGHDAQADTTALTDGPGPDMGVVIDAYISPDSGGPPPAKDPIPPECMAAAKKGLAWLVTQQGADGTWTGGGATYSMAQTSLAVLKLETYAFESGKTPFDPSYEYNKQFVLGFNHILKNLAVKPIAGPEDTNGNGKGVTYPSGRESYEAALALMAIAGSKATDRMVDVAGSEVYGWPYQLVAQDMVDYFAHCQVPGVGGWPYTCPSSGPDNSNSQYVSLALEYAEHDEYHFKCTIPDSVRTGLVTWIAYIQDLNPGPYYGASGYNAPGTYPNAYKTGALMQQLALVGSDKTTAPVQAAMEFLANYWAPSFTPSCPCGAGWRGDPADYMAMWSTMKGLIAQDFDKVGGVDWYKDFCDVLIAQQLPDGSWPSMGCDTYVNAQGVLSTEWALLVLERAAPPPPGSITPH